MRFVAAIECAASMLLLGGAAVQHLSTSDLTVSLVLGVGIGLLGIFTLLVADD